MRRRLPTWAALAAAVLLAGGLLHGPRAEAQVASEAANWCEQAEKSLTDRHGNAVSCAAVAKRCVRMNNYWCQKHGSSPWRGTAARDGKDGLRDVDGHAIFEAVEWSARAIAIDLRAKYRRGLVSALQIAAMFSPWCDTLGSKAVVSGSGRTCNDGRAKPPPGFAGPRCVQPATALLDKASCQVGCNCPPAIAELLVQGTSLDIHVDLALFDSAGRPRPNLAVVIRNLAIQEQGIYVRPEVVAAGIGRL